MDASACCGDFDLAGFDLRKVDSRLGDVVDVVGEDVEGDVADGFDEVFVGESGTTGGLEVGVAHLSPAHDDTAGKLQDRERASIEAALKECGGKIFGADGAAELLEMKPTTLASRIKKLGIDKSSLAG